MQKMRLFFPRGKKTMGKFLGYPRKNPRSHPETGTHHDVASSNGTSLSDHFQVPHAGHGRRVELR